MSGIDPLFGPFVGGDDVHDAVVATLTLWTPTYVAAVNRQIGQHRLRVPFAYVYKPENRARTEAPGEVAIVVAVPGTIGEPFRQGNGVVRSMWAFNVQANVFGGQDYQVTMESAYAWGKCLAAMLTQQGSLGEFASSTRWLGVTYGEGKLSSTRTTGVAEARFACVVEATIRTFGGPPIPNVAPPTENPIVETIDTPVDQLTA